MQFFKLAAVALFFMMQFNVERAVSQEVDGVGDQEEVSRDEVDEGEDYGVIFLFGSINDKSINFLMQTINNMQKRDVDRIWLIINSGGGTVESALSFYNMVQSFDVKLDTYNVGQASSAAAMMFEIFRYDSELGAGPIQTASSANFTCKLSSSAFE